VTQTPRQRGDAFERRTRAQLDAAGYRTLRSSGSSGPFDLVALRLGELHLIQCKADGRLDPAEWNELLDLAVELGGTAILAQRDPRRHIEYRRLTHHKGKPRDGAVPLWEPWAPIVALGW
jgi:Holliday junction resolvase